MIKTHHSLLPLNCYLYIDTCRIESIPIVSFSEFYIPISKISPNSQLNIGIQPSSSRSKRNSHSHNKQTTHPTTPLKATANHIPESSCAQIGFHALHASQTPSNTSRSLWSTWILPWLSTNSNDSPWLACHAIWQCASHAPGLSSSKAMARYPLPGSVAVSRREGLDVAKVDVLPSNMPVSDARIQKSWPCRWKGWATLFWLVS